MPILVAATVTFGVTLVACLVLLAIMGRQKRADDKELERVDQLRDEDGALIASLYREAGFSEMEIDYLHGRVRALTDSLVEAIEQGELAAVASMNILARERDESLESLQAWVFAAKFWALVAQQPRALTPPAPEPPRALPSGDFLVADDDGPVILQLDDFELPAGTRGTGA